MAKEAFLAKRKKRLFLKPYMFRLSSISNLVRLHNSDQVQDEEVILSPCLVIQAVAIHLYTTSVKLALRKLNECNNQCTHIALCAHCKH